jgi:hypothetical protein
MVDAFERASGRKIRTKLSADDQETLRSAMQILRWFTKLSDGRQREGSTRCAQIHGASSLRTQMDIANSEHRSFEIGR